MRLFACQACGNAVHFDNTACLACGRRLGYLPDRVTITALEPDGDRWRALADPTRPVILCANARHDACNWLL
ncbi:zinc-ribbon domain-containing protein, partial [Mycobacterium tuberculosis]|nr:zinc-ribbon domain-containing protein [Mycobacterium tuberculosis]